MSEVFKIFEHKPTRVYAAKYTGEDAKLFKKEFPECPMHLFEACIGLWIVRKEDKNGYGWWSKWTDKAFKERYREVSDE